MENVFDWLHTDRRVDSPWLVIGKGPSFAQRNEFNLSGYRTLGLNDIAREMHVDVLHVIDLSVLDRLDEATVSHFGYLLIPWVPHEDYRLPMSDKVFHRPSVDNLSKHVARHPLLRRLNAEGRLLWYDASSGSCLGPGHHPVVRVGTFSAAAVVNLLAKAGVRRLRTLGVDGGRSYAGAFTDLTTVSLLDAGQSSYDLQFADMARTIRQERVDLAPLGVDVPVRVYVGTQPEQMLATQILEYSIRRHASLTVEVIPLHEAIQQAGIHYQVPNTGGLRQRTPFSFQRFVIPQLNGYRGRAIYLDSDMQVFQDIRTLWLWPFRGADVMAVVPRDDHRRNGPQFSVMVMDCAALHWDIHALLARLERGEMTYEQMVYGMAAASHATCNLPRTWNDLEHFRDGETALLHYTDMSTQPWVCAHNPLGHLWCGEVMDAIADGVLSIDNIREQVARGWVRPSLLYQIEHGIRDPLLLPARVARRDDREFVPPLHYVSSFRTVTGYGLAKRRSWQHALRRAYAWLRYLWVISGLQALARSGKRQFRKLLTLLRPRKA